MTHSTPKFRTFFVSRSVAAVFGLQVACFLGAHAATRIGLHTLADYLGVVIDGAIFALLLAFQLIPWSWFSGIHVTNGLILSIIVLLAYFTVYYAVAIVIAAPGRIVYRFIGNRESQ